MKSKYLITILSLMVFVLPLGGIAFARYKLVPQTNKGPHGGAMVLIDKSVSRFVEFVASPQGEEWLLQLYCYNKKMEPREFLSSARADIESNDGQKVSVDLFDTNNFSVLFAPAGHLEARTKLGHAAQFKAKVMLFSGRRHSVTDELDFKYPY